jgi:hypothetical protein
MNKWLKRSLITLGSLALYVLSSGPVCVLVHNHWLPQFVMAIYLPLAWLGLAYQPLGALLLGYVLWWNDITGGSVFTPF